MVTPLSKKYIEHFDIIFKILGLDRLDDAVAKATALRRYISELDRFSAPGNFEGDFMRLLEARDKTVCGEKQAEPELSDHHEQVDDILDQVLSVLEDGVVTSKDTGVAVVDLVHKLKKAKTINSVRNLSREVISAGEEMVSSSKSMQNGLGQIAIELSFYQKRIKDLEGELKATKEETRVDHLTGLFNRKAFDRDVQETLGRCRRFHRPACLLLLDIDFFKKMNDQWGHKAGDDVLVNFSKLLLKSLRQLDLTYRLGGDEFAIIFNDYSLDHAITIAERVRQFVSSRVYKVADLKFTLSVSGGISELSKDEDQDSWFKRSDQALYRAKHAGRNRIHVDPEP